MQQWRFLIFFHNVVYVCAETREIREMKIRDEFRRSKLIAMVRLPGGIFQRRGMKFCHWYEGYEIDDSNYMQYGVYVWKMIRV